MVFTDGIRSKSGLLILNRRHDHQERGVVEINRKRNNQNWRMVALYGSLSINLGIMILGGYFLGRLLEKQYQWSNMSLTGLLTGLFLGLYQMFIVAFKATDKKK
ncbi:MAG: AtpZ/AtpI family protein [Firmicutes bacterium]|nr:AtpZ/AtpI family protein [Bacillota bacterium]